VKKRVLCGMAVLFLLPPAAQAKLKLPAIIGDHMVLQRGKPVVWGWDTPGQKVTVTLAGRSASALADADGKWKVELSLPKAGGPYDMVVSGDGAVTVTDVLLGQVWVGSGQSNMEFAMKTSSDADKEIPAADHPRLRLFTVEHVCSLKPEDDVQGSWKACTPASAADFSAVAYHFGNDLQQALKEPLGLVVSCWGGTAAEAWTPRDALEADPALAGTLKQWDENNRQTRTWTTGDEFQLQISNIRFIPKDPKDRPLTVEVSPSGKGPGGPWTTSAKPGCQASVTATGKAFEGGGPALLFSGTMMGGGWGGLAASLSGKNGPLDLSRYQSVEFEAKGQGQYRLTLGQPSITDYDDYATDTFTAGPDWKKMSFPIDSLKQGGWGVPRAFTQDKVTSLNFPVQVPYWPDIAAACYNGMTVPLEPMRIAGVLWYQGESNTGRPGEYQNLLSDLVQSWRKAWGEGNFPFLIVQLPNYMAVKDEPSESGWAGVREAQRRDALGLPEAGLVPLIDLGEADNIHPRDKTDVGQRAALAAEDLFYRKPPLDPVPEPEKAWRRGRQVLVRFKNRGRGLTVKGGGDLKGFALAGPDGTFHWAKAALKWGTVRLECDQVPDPQAVRYAWADNPVCNLYGENGLPVPPFQLELKAGAGKSRR
jgi:sialate O-acetylesterase